jgi:hypothetical protein
MILTQCHAIAQRLPIHLLFGKTRAWAVLVSGWRSRLTRENTPEIGVEYMNTPMRDIMSLE